MTVAELMAELAKMPPDAVVCKLDNWGNLVAATRVKNEPHDESHYLARSCRRKIKTAIITIEFY